MNKPAPETLLTKAEAKAKLGNISDGTLSRLIKQGKLRAVKFGKTTPLRFRALDVERCLENLLTPAIGESTAGGDARPTEASAATLNAPKPC